MTIMLSSLALRCFLLATFVICTSLGSAPAKAATVQKTGFTYIGEIEKVVATYEDTLVHLARANNLGFVEIRAANPDLDPWIPGKGAKVLLPKMHVLPDAPQIGVVINLPEMRLYYFPSGDTEPLSYPIGIGREGLQTPVGGTNITRKKEGPTWRPTERMREEDPELPAVVEPGPDNPLGTHALYLGWPQYLIHGTNKPYGIGRRVSSGCIRMYPEGIKDIFPRVDTGTPVRVVNQPLKAAWIDDTLYLEAHPSVEDTTEMEREGKILEYNASEADIQYITKIAGDDVQALDWDKVRELIKLRNGYPVAVGKRVPDRAPYRDDDSKDDKKSAEAKPVDIKEILKKEDSTAEEEASEKSSNYEASRAEDLYLNAN